MYYFFQPTQLSPGHAVMAIANAPLHELVVRPGAVAKIGLWGKENGNPLEVRAYRGGSRVSGSASSPVKLSRLSHDPKLNAQVYHVTGLRQGDTLVGATPNGDVLTVPLPVFELRNTPSGLMREAANAFAAKGGRPKIAGICNDAVPYLALRHATMTGMTVLWDTHHPLQSVHGLAVHTTAGDTNRSPYVMARFGCVQPWNSGTVSAHFGVARDGTLVQFVPTTFVAHAQFDPGNQHWISVEVDNDGTASMNAQQMATVQLLFRWVADTYNIGRRLATGCLFPKSAHFDKATGEVCARGNAETTTDPYVACMSRGLSCHWWLEANKGGHSHGCPGPGILSQLDQVAHG